MGFHNSHDYKSKQKSKTSAYTESEGGTTDTAASEQEQHFHIPIYLKELYKDAEKRKKSEEMYFQKVPTTLSNKQKL